MAWGKTRLSPWQTRTEKRARRQPRPKVPWGFSCRSPSEKPRASCARHLSSKYLRAGCRVVPHSIRATTRISSLSDAPGHGRASLVNYQPHKPRVLGGRGSRSAFVACSQSCETGPTCQNTKRRSRSKHSLPGSSRAARVRGGVNPSGRTQAHRGRSIELLRGSRYARPFAAANDREPDPGQKENRVGGAVDPARRLGPRHRCGGTWPLTTPRRSDISASSRPGASTKTDESQFIRGRAHQSPNRATRGNKKGRLCAAFQPRSSRDGRPTCVQRAAVLAATARDRIGRIFFSGSGIVIIGGH